MSADWGRPITANLLTGFLGAGKTSLLRRLLRKPDLADTAVIINEFGEVGLDHLLIEEVDEDIVLLKSGCVCCTIRGDLKEAFTRLHGRRQKGEVPPFSRLVIETTGLADPVPILATITTDPMLRHHFQMGNTVCVLDALSGAGNLANYLEAARQAAVADRLVISKVDLAAAGAVDDLRRRLAGINPAAEIVLADEATDPEAALLTHDVHGEALRSEEVRRWLAAGDAVEAHAYEAGHSAHDEHAPHAHDESRHGEIRSLMLTADEPLNWVDLALWLSMLTNRYGERILRLKGLVAVEGQDTPLVLQGVQHLIHAPMHLPSWPDGDRRTRLVVIERGLDPALIRRSFEAFVGAGRIRHAAA